LGIPGGESSGGGDDDEEDEGAIDLGSNEDNTFTIRTSASRAIDDLAEVFGPEVTLPLILPLVEQLLQSNEWVRQECAVLVLGAIAGERCMPGLVPHLHAFYPLLLRLAGTQANTGAPAARFEMQKTVAWTLGRFALVVCENPDARMKDETLKALLTMMRSPVKLVQRAACSGVAHLVEVAGDLIEDSFGVSGVLSCYLRLPLCLCCLIVPLESV
jgi:transportin-1